MGFGSGRPSDAGRSDQRGPVVPLCPWEFISFPELLDPVDDVPEVSDEPLVPDELLLLPLCARDLCLEVVVVPEVSEP